VLGTDELGRDVLSRLLFGLRSAVGTGLLVAGLVFAVATGWAMLGAWVRRTSDRWGDALEEFVLLPLEILRAFPWLVLLLLLLPVMAWHSPRMSLWLGGTLITAVAAGLVLLPRAVAMLREASRAPPPGRGWLSGVLWAVPVMAVFTAAAGFLYVITLSFVGVGITTPPTPSLGGVVSEGQRYLLVAPWMVAGPGVIMAVVLTIWVMTGDTLLERLGYRSKAVWTKSME
jgi:peptide/nickel transport system permease protein